MLSASTYKTSPSGSSLLEDAELALNNLSHQEVQLIRETEELFKQQVSFMVKIDLLREFIPDIKTISDNTHRLLLLIDSSFTLAQDVCGKFKNVDLAKLRLNDSLSKISDILDLKTCRDGLLDAMRAHNYETAAMHIKRFLSIDQAQLQRTVSIICDDTKTQKQRRAIEAIGAFGSQAKLSEANPASHYPQPQSFITIDPKQIQTSLKELSEARCQLHKLCQEKMTLAIKENSTKEIEHFLKIFPLLNEHSDGLQRYSEYIKSKIIDSQLIDKLSSIELSHTDKLASLYESVAKLIDFHQPMIETYYGPGHLIIVARIVQGECDKLSRKILEDFRNETNLQALAKVVRAAVHIPIVVAAPKSNPGLNNINSTNLSLSQCDKLDPRQLDKVLNDISMIISRSEIYLSFLTKRIQDDIDSQTEDEMQRKQATLELYNMICSECELNHLIQEVGGIYVMFEQFYMNESSKKAILMDQVDMDPSFGTCYISSMLDDIFFIIKKCTKRAVSTRSNQVFCAIVNHCVTLLEAAFCSILEDRLKTQQYFNTFSAKSLDFSQAYTALQSGRYLQSATDLKKSIGLYFAALNNLDKACDYIKTLRNMLDTDIKKLKPSTILINYNSDAQKSITCLNELTRLIHKFTSIVNSSLYQLFNTSIRSRIKTELANLIEEDPDLIEILSETNTNELTSLAKSMLRTSDSSLEASLLPDNYARLICITRDFLSSSGKTIK